MYGVTGRARPQVVVNGLQPAGKIGLRNLPPRLHLVEPDLRGEFHLLLETIHGLLDAGADLGGKIHVNAVDPVTAAKLRELVVGHGIEL